MAKKIKGVVISDQMLTPEQKKELAKRMLEDNGNIFITQEEADTSSTIVPGEEITPLQPNKTYCPFDIVTNNDILDNMRSELSEAPTKIAREFYDKRTANAPTFNNMIRPENTPEYLLDENGNLRNGIPLNGMFLGTIDPARHATLNMASAAYNAENIQKADVNTYRALLKQNFQTVSSYIMHSMFDTINEGLLALYIKYFKDMVCNDPYHSSSYNIEPSYKLNFYEIRNFDVLTNLSSYRTMINSNGEINLIVSENTLAMHVSLITNQILMKYLTSIALISRQNCVSIEDADERFYELRCKFLSDYMSEITSFVYDTLKEILKVASMHIALMIRDDVGLATTLKDDNKYPFSIIGYKSYYDE